MGKFSGDGGRTDCRVADAAGGLAVGATIRERNFAARFAKNSFGIIWGRGGAVRGGSQSCLPIV